MEIVSDRAVPPLPQGFERRLTYFDHTLFLKWGGRFWQIWRKAPSGRIVHILNIERDGQYVQPGEWVLQLLHQMDAGKWPGGVTEYLNRLDAENEEQQRRIEATADENLLEATKDALWSGAMKELEAI